MVAISVAASAERFASSAARSAASFWPRAYHTAQTATMTARQEMTKDATITPDIQACRGGGHCRTGRASWDGCVAGDREVDLWSGPPVAAWAGYWCRCAVVGALFCFW